MGSSAKEIAQLLGWATTTVYVIHSRWAKERGCLSHFLTVLRESPVPFAIALFDSLSRKLMRLILPIMSMVITSLLLPKIWAGLV